VAWLIIKWPVAILDTAQQMHLFGHV
jgi:hypothetical protein